MLNNEVLHSARVGGMTPDSLMSPELVLPGNTSPAEPATWSQYATEPLSMKYGASVQLSCCLELL